MELYFRVRNVLHSPGRSAVTLDPTEFLVESDHEMVEAGGEKVPALVPGSWDDPALADIRQGDGPVTELRFDDTTDLRPGDLVGVTLWAIPEPNWDPDGNRIDV